MISLELEFSQGKVQFSVVEEGLVRPSTRFRSVSTAVLLFHPAKVWSFCTVACSACAPANGFVAVHIAFCVAALFTVGKGYLGVLEERV